jgi:ABC-type cobalt transport system substrate-binding protein
MKKLLLLLFIMSITFSFSQQKDKNTTSKNEIVATISNISAYPNPFSESTKISFTSTQLQSINFSIKNLLGKTIFKQTLSAKKGFNSFKFNRSNFTRGMYIYSLQTNNEVISKRLIMR